MAGIIPTVLFGVGLWALARYLYRRDAQGDWDKEGHGSPGRRGIEFRPLEVPPSQPFD